MAQTNVNIRMDDATKKQFEVICNELGLNMSTAFNIFAKTVVRQHRIPFELNVDPFFCSNAVLIQQWSSEDYETPICKHCYVNTFSDSFFTE